MKQFPKPITTVYLQLDKVKPIKIDHEYIVIYNRFVDDYTAIGSHNTQIEVWQNTSLAAANELRNMHPDEKIVVLHLLEILVNFFNGAQAQEESLAQSSSLYKSCS